MSSLPLFVGLDYHQKHVQICVLDQHGNQRLNRQCENDPIALSQALSNMRPAKVAIEACTGAADLAERLVDDLGWHVELAHSGYVARLKQSPDKTDFSDARLLADLTRVGYLPRVWLAPAPIRNLRQLVYHRQRLIDQRRNAKLRIGAIMREHRLNLPDAIARCRWSRLWREAVRGLPWPDAIRFVVDDLFDEIDTLVKRLRRIEQQLRDVTKDDAVVQRLLAIEGVGPVTAWTLRACIGQFDRFKTGKQLARYCGLSPRNASSGEKQGDAGLIRMASPRLRCTLIQAGQRLMRSRGRWGRLGQRLTAKGKPYNVAVAAVANRWMRWLYYEMKRQQPAFEPPSREA